MPHPIVKGVVQFFAGIIALIKRFAMLLNFRQGFGFGVLGCWLSFYQVGLELKGEMVRWISQGKKVFKMEGRIGFRARWRFC